MTGIKLAAEVYDVEKVVIVNEKKNKANLTALQASPVNRGG